MGYYDRYYENKEVEYRAYQEERCEKIIKRFENLSLEEKVDKLIDIYAREKVYRG